MLLSATAAPPSRAGLLAALALGACSPDPVTPTEAPSATPTTTVAARFDWQVELDGLEGGLLMSVWGASADDVWLGGGQPEAGLVLRGRSGAWQPLALPEGAPLLNWVHGSGPDDVWVGGLRGALYRWDGGAWHDHSVDVDEAIWGVHAASPTEAVAVGGGGRYGGSHAVAFGWDGQRWEALPLPLAAVDSPGLFKVDRRGADWWIVGAGGLALAGPADALEIAPTGTAQDLVTVDGGPDGTTVAVGGRSTGLILLPAGEGLYPSQDARAGLSGVDVAEATRAVVVGELGFAALYDPTQPGLREEPVPTSFSLHGVWIDPDGRVYAVGGNLSAQPPYAGVLAVGDLPGGRP